DVAAHAGDAHGGAAQPDEERGDVVGAHLLGALVAAVSAVGARVGAADRQVIGRSVGLQALIEGATAAVAVVPPATLDDARDGLLVQVDGALDLPAGVLEVGL